MCVKMSSLKSEEKILPATVKIKNEDWFVEIQYFVYTMKSDTFVDDLCDY